MSWGRDAIQFLPLVPGFANEQIKGLLQQAGWQEARLICLRGTQTFQGQFCFAGLCCVQVMILSGWSESPLAFPSPSLHTYHQGETSEMSRLFKTGLNAWIGCSANLTVPLLSHTC